MKALKALGLIVCSVACLIGCGHEREITAPILLPDLKINITSYPQSIRVNESFAVIAQVINDGEGGTGQSIICTLWIDSAQRAVKTVDPLDAQTNLIAEFKFAFSPMLGFTSNVGEHMIQVQVDRLDYQGLRVIGFIPELDEDNNEDEVMIEVLD